MNETRLGIKDKKWDFLIKTVIVRESTNDRGTVSVEVNKTEDIKPGVTRPTVTEDTLQIIEDEVADMTVVVDIHRTTEEEVAGMIPVEVEVDMFLEVDTGDNEVVMTEVLEVVEAVGMFQEVVMCQEVVTCQEAREVVHEVGITVIWEAENLITTLS